MSAHRTCRDKCRNSVCEVAAASVIDVLNLNTWSIPMPVATSTIWQYMYHKLKNEKI
jgi:hypothetical protein